jgi:hypothetical protein
MRSIASLLGSVALAACSESVTFRYRLAVEVMTPNGIKTGATVLECTEVDNSHNILALNKTLFPYLRGQAIVVDLGPPGLLFVLLNGQLGVRRMPLYVALTEKLVSSWGIDPVDGKQKIRAGAEIVRDLARITSTIEIPHKDLQRFLRFARFRDLSDPSSIEFLNLDSIGATFGNGVKLLRVTILMTRDPVTTGIEKRLGWSTEDGTAQRFLALDGMNLTE